MSGPGAGAEATHSLGALRPAGRPGSHFPEVLASLIAEKSTSADDTSGAYNSTSAMETNTSGEAANRKRRWQALLARPWAGERKWAESSEGMRRWVRRWCKAHVTFYRLHLAYFTLVATAATLLLWLSPKPSGPIALIDALFGVTSALCLTGMFSLRMSRLSQLDKVVLMFVMLLGSQVFTSLLPVYVRRFYLRRYIRAYYSKAQQPWRPGRLLGQSISPPSVPEADAYADPEDPDVPVRPAWKASSLGNVFDEHGKFVSFKSDTRHHGQGRLGTWAHRTWSGETFRHEARKFALAVHVSEALSSRLEERESKAMGGEARSGGEVEEEEELEDETFPDLRRGSSKALEHEALTCLCWLVPAYLLGTLLTSFLLLQLYLLRAPDARRALKERDVDETFFAMFISVSAFANAGLSVVDESMVPFQRSALLLLICTGLILAGNTLFPACMRSGIWLLSRLAHAYGRPRRQAVFRYLLTHPRRCYTHLFPRRHTVWLVVTVVALNAVEITAFCALDWRSSALAGLGAGYKLVDGVFQSASTRSAGLQAVYLAELSSAMLVLYVAMMYVAAYPIFLSRQNSMAPREVYDEADLGVYGRSWEAELVESRLSWQARALLARDSVYLFLAVFLVCAIHNRHVKEDALNFSIFNIIFEVISAYGTVGLSVGYSCDLARQLQPRVACQDVPYSFSGKWTPAGKAVLVVVMFLGRHRGLPENIDSAVQLPRRKEFSVRGTRQGSLSTLGDPALRVAHAGRASGGGRGAHSSSPGGPPPPVEPHRNSLSPSRCQILQQVLVA